MRHIDSRQLIEEAKSGGYAIAAINISNMETAAAALGAASKLDAPVFVQVSPLQMQTQGFSYLRMIRIIDAVASDLPSGRYSVHLDHSVEQADCFSALEAGFDSVMFDGAMLPYEQNIAMVAAVKKKTGGALEGELGVVGGGEAASTDVSMQYTNPAVVRDFVERTHVDWLAVAIGNAHGTYTSQPQLRFDILQAISQKVSIPLVLHGASGIPHDDLRRGIKMGIAKINFFTELDIAFRQGWKEADTGASYMMKLARGAQDAMQSKAEELINLCIGC